jgi:hypothetical protein
MGVQDSLEQALRSPEPVNALRALALQLFAEGQTKAAIVASFEAARQRLRAEQREADEDTVMDAMDFPVGWCSPHMKLSGDPSPLAPEVKP